VDRAGVRTEVALNPNETAVVKKIPVSIRSRAPVNVVVGRYDRKAVRLFANGQGKIKLLLRNGDFPVKAGTEYRIKAAVECKTIAGKDGVLSLTIPLSGQMEIAIEPAIT
jgi:hypothetical protein